MGWRVLREETGLDEFENTGFPGVRMRFDIDEVVFPFVLGLKNTVPLKKVISNIKNQHDLCQGFQQNQKLHNFLK